MRTEYEDSRDFIREFTKNEIVAELAPEEVDFFDGLVDQNLTADIEDAAAGFEETVVIMISPIAIEVVTQTLKFISDELLKNAGQETASNVFSKIRSYLARKLKENDSLTAEQLLQIRAKAYKTAVKNGLDSANAQLMADTLVGSLLSKN